MKFLIIPLLRGIASLASCSDKYKNGSQTAHSQRITDAEQIVPTDYGKRTCQLEQRASSNTGTASMLATTKV
jgi:hypothetical protein